MCDVAGELPDAVESLRLREVRRQLPPGPYVAIEVRDSGAGLDRAALEHVFEPFFSTKFTGRGLGLSEALGVVSSHGGGMVVESEVGVGSAFTMLLPLAGDRAGDYS